MGVQSLQDDSPLTERSSRLRNQPRYHLIPAASPLSTDSPASLLPQPDVGTGRRIVAWLATFIGVTVPLVGLAGACILLWGWGFSWVDLWLLLGMYLATMIGVTVGFHRLFTHRSFETIRPIQILLGVLGSMTFQGPLIPWVGRHRQHHRFSDC